MLGKTLSLLWGGDAGYSQQNTPAVAQPSHKIGTRPQLTPGASKGPALCCQLRPSMGLTGKDWTPEATLRPQVGVLLLVMRGTSWPQEGHLCLACGGAPALSSWLLALCLQVG